MGQSGNALRRTPPPRGPAGDGSSRRPLVLIDVDASDLHDAVFQAERALRAAPGVSEAYAEAAQACLRRRADEGPDVNEAGVVIVHGTIDEPGPPLAALLRVAEPIRHDDEDAPIEFVWVMVSNRGTHPRLARAVEFAHRLKDPDVAAAAHAATTPDRLLQVYARAVARRVELADAPAGLEHSGRLFGGMIADVRRRAPLWAADFRAGLHPKAVASMLFMYFACLAPAVAFGGLLSELTGGQIGAVETVLASALCGTLWALFAGQPLAIVGATGPNVVFTGILYALCVQYDVPFLPTAAWTGLWTMVFLWVLAATDASVLIRYFSRFTDEIFAALIALIFVVQACQDILAAFETHPHAVALLTTLLAYGTFGLALGLARMRRRVQMRKPIRMFLADFGPAIAIASMTAVAFFFDAIPLPTLAVPETFGPTAERSWFVSPLDAPVWVWGASAAPALLLTILIWFNQNVTARLIQSPDHKLQKGPAYHWDIAVMGALVGLTSLFGLPWVVGAVVRSLNHVRSLEQDEGGVLENRLSNLGVHLLIGASLLFFLPLLALIPMAVLFGVFLFMGVGSLGGNQFVDRLKLVAMDPERYPADHPHRVVPTGVLHTFTGIQAVCLGLLWWVKSGPFGLAFPFFVALLVPVRMALGRVFEPEHLALLDEDELPADEEFREVGS